MKKSNLLLQSLGIAFSAALLLATHLAAQVVPAQPGPRPAPRPPVRPVRPGIPGAPGGGGAAEPAPKFDGSAGAEIEKHGLKFDATDSLLVLEAYADLSKKTLIFHPQVPKASITLKSHPDQFLNTEDKLYAIRQALNQNGIDIRPFGDGSLFLNVVPLNLPTGPNPEFPITLTYTNGVLNNLLSEPPYGRTSSVVYQLIHISTEEGKKIIEPYKRPEGQLIATERNNSITIIDTYENVAVMIKLLEVIDKPIPITEEVYSRKILFAKAADIKKKLEEIVAKSQEQSQGASSSGISRSGAATIVNTPPTPRIVRPTPPGLPVPPEAPANNPSISTAISDADKGMIRGKVQIIDDERTNMLIIITNPQNMAFFDKIIAVCDVETAPPVIVDVIRMEHANAKDVSALLNDLLGSVKPATTADAARPGDLRARNRGTTLADAAAANNEIPTTASVVSEATQSSIGQLNKENIKILNDERSNAVIIMASPADLASLREIIRSIDIQLSQVLIEIVILDVALAENFNLGIDWFTQNNKNETTYDADGNPTVSSTLRTQSRFGGGTLVPVTPGAPATALAGITHFFTSKRLNLDAIISATADDTKAQVLASPVLLTMDNKEATIDVTESRYFFNGYRYDYSGGTTQERADVTPKDIGLKVTITPRINLNGMVVLTLKGNFDSVSPTPQNIDGTAWPTTLNRKINVDVAIESGETLILGGLNSREKGVTKTGVPYLRNIPLLGWLFRHTEETEKRSELLIFMTPYVLDTASQRALETARRKRVVGDNADIWTEHISGSILATPDPKEEMRLLSQELSSDKEYIKAAEKLEKLRNEQDAERQRLNLRRQVLPAPAQPLSYNDGVLANPASHNPHVRVINRGEAAGILNTLPPGAEPQASTQNEAVERFINAIRNAAAEQQKNAK